MEGGGPLAGERAEILRRLRRLWPYVISQAELVATPHEAYDPLPPRLLGVPARILRDVQDECRYLIEVVLLGRVQPTGVMRLTAVRSEEGADSPDDERPFAEFAEECRAEMRRLLDLLDGVNLDQLSAGKVWIFADETCHADEQRQVSVRWLLVDMVERLARAGGQLRTYFDLSGLLVDDEA